MNWKVCGRKRSWPNIRYYPGNCLQGLRKTTKDLSHDSRSLVRDLNTGSPKYGTGVITTLSRHSVKLNVDFLQPQCCSVVYKNNPNKSCTFLEGHIR
jgi:hypothetical protein